MISKGNRVITEEELYRKFTQEQLLFTYLPQVQRLPCVICSPLREDKTPSFSLCEINGIVSYYDFATKEKGDIISLLKNFFGLRTRSETIEKIYNNSLSPISINAGTRKVKYVGRSRNVSLETVQREWTEDDFLYWESYGVSRKFIQKSNTFPIKYIILVVGGDTTLIKADKYAYTYIENKDNIISQKVYQPFNKDGFKWRYSGDFSVISMFSLLPEKGEYLIITSSKKDAMCLWDNLKIPAIAPQSELTTIKPQVIKQLKERFKHIFVLFDNDFNKEMNTGQVYAKEFCDKYDLVNLTIPTELQAKDPSDLYKKYDKKLFIKTIYSLIKTHLL